MARDLDTYPWLKKPKDVVPPTEAQKAADAAVASAEDAKEHLDESLNK